MGGKFRPGTLSEMLNRSPPRTFFEVHQIQNLTQFPYDTDFFQKPLEWFGEHTIEEAVEILSTETNII